jgi:hypothetical protein
VSRLSLHAWTPLAGGLFKVSGFVEIGPKSFALRHRCGYKMRGIMQLLRLFYRGRNKKASKERVGGLRDILCGYLAKNVCFLRNEESFVDFLEEGGQFVKDMWRYRLREFSEARQETRT